MLKTTLEDASFEEGVEQTVEQASKSRVGKESMLASGPSLNIIDSGAMASNYHMDVALSFSHTL